jgi:hypothetical protein
MKRDYLGDSYDAVKRLWQQILAAWAPLYAEPRFIPEDVRADFTRLTGIPILRDAPKAAYSILNDPDTGIRLPDGDDQTQSRHHITLPAICGSSFDRVWPAPSLLSIRALIAIENISPFSRGKPKCAISPTRGYLLFTTSPMRHSFSPFPLMRRGRSFGTAY